MKTFWKQVLSSPLRAISFFIVLICHKGGLSGMAIGVCIMLMLSYFIQQTVKINWRSSNTQFIADALSLFLAAYFVLDRIGLARFLGEIISYCALGIVILAVIVVVLNK